MNRSDKMSLGLAVSNRESNESIPGPDFKFIEDQSNQDLQTIWSSFWASRADWDYEDKGPNGFATNWDWALALNSELDKRGLPK